MDNETRKLIKKYESNMIISGMGMLFFGMWDVFKFIAGFLYNGNTTYNRELNKLLADQDLSVFLIWTIIGLTSMVIMSFALYIGVKAIKYGKGIKRKKGFLVVVAILGILNLAVIPQYVTEFNADEAQVAAIVATILVDLLFVSMAFDMVWSAIRIGILNRKNEKEA